MLKIKYKSVRSKKYSEVPQLTSDSAVHNDHV